MYYVQPSNQPEFKGIYYNESKEQKYFEGGAHFRYKDLYHILEKLKHYQIESSFDKKVIHQRNDSNCKENNDYTLKQPKTRNNNNSNANNNEKAFPKQSTTCRNNTNQKNYFLNQCIQSKYLGMSLYMNQNSKRQAVNKYKQIPREACINKKSNNNNHQIGSLANPPKPKSNSAKRIQSEDAHSNHSNAFAKTAIQTARQNGRETGSNTQRVKEYTDRLNKPSSSSNGKGNSQSRNINAISISNANPNTYVFSNGHTSTKQNKSRNCNQIGGNGLFDSLSFQTKQSWRGKDQKDTSGRNTIDNKIGMVKKAIAIRKIGGGGGGGGSISITSRLQKASIDKYHKISYITSNNKATISTTAAHLHHQKTNSNVGYQNKSMKKGFLASFDK